MLVFGRFGDFSSEKNGLPESQENQERMVGTELFRGDFEGVTRTSEKRQAWKQSKKTGWRWDRLDTDDDDVCAPFATFQTIYSC